LLNMPRKKPEIPFVEIMKKLNSAGLKKTAPNRVLSGEEEIMSLENRVEYLLDIIHRDKRPASNMLFFVMYDIESNKVRYQIMKYLIKKGCTRVQKSIFLADLPSSIYNTIREELALVQESYDNNDSILIFPISTDYLSAMKIIGQSIDIDVITRSKNTLFF